jgi:hypothetical protein
LVDFGRGLVPSESVIVNSAIPWYDDIVLINERWSGTVMMYDIVKRKVIQRVVCPWLMNSHHPTPFGDTLLISDADSIVQVDMNGKLLLRSPALFWPRGILVKSKQEVWVTDATALVRWNPESNAIEKRLESPIHQPQVWNKGPAPKATIVGGALFDLTEADVNVPECPLEKQEWYPIYLEDEAVIERWREPPGTLDEIVAKAMTMNWRSRDVYVRAVLLNHPNLTPEVVYARIRETLAAWKGGDRFGYRSANV